MLYGDRAYCIAHAHNRTKGAPGRAPRGEVRDDRANDEDSEAPEHLGAGTAGRGVSSVRYRRLRRAK